MANCNFVSKASSIVYASAILEEASNPITATIIFFGRQNIFQVSFAYVIIYNKPNLLIGISVLLCLGDACTRDEVARVKTLIVLKITSF